jgi:hypothetical protein
MNRKKSLGDLEDLRNSCKEDFDGYDRKGKKIKYCKGNEIRYYLAEIAYHTRLIETKQKLYEEANGVLERRQNRFVKISNLFKLPIISRFGKYGGLVKIAGGRVNEAKECMDNIQGQINRDTNALNYFKKAHDDIFKTSDRRAVG